MRTTFATPTPKSSGRARQMASEANSPSPLLTIRPVRPDDTVALTAILQEAPETLSWRLDAPGSATATTQGVFFVADSNGQPVGFVMARGVMDEAEIFNIVVRQSHRRSGIGSALLEATLDDARAHQVGRVFLEVRES